MSSGRRAPTRTSSRTPPRPSRSGSRARAEPVPAQTPGPVPVVEWIVLGALVAGYVAAFGTAVWVKHQFFLYTDFDLAIFTQAVDRIVHGSLWNSVRGMHWPGDHSSLILFPIAPLVAPFRSPLALLILQTLALALGAIPAHRLARRLTGDGMAALAVAALYLLHPAIGYVNLFEFHPEALATAPLLAAIADLTEGRTRRGVVFAALALLAREDVALVVLGLAAFTLFGGGPRARRTAAELAGLALLSLAATFAVLRPLFAHGETEYARMFDAWGQTPGAILANLATRPWEAVASLWSTPGQPGDGVLKREYWGHLLLPVLALPLAAPRLLLAALPLIALHLLSSRPQQHTIVYQYSAAIVPFVIAAAAFGLARAGGFAGAGRARNATRVVALVAVLVALACQWMFGPLMGHGIWQSHRATQRWQPDEAARRLRPHRDRVLAQVPRDDAVVASFEFLPRLASRRELHSFHHLLSGTYTYSRRPYPPPARVDAMLTAQGGEFRSRASQERMLRLIARDTLRPVDGYDDVLLLRRGARDTLELLTPGVEPSARMPVVYDGQLALRGIDPIAPVGSPGEPMTIRTYWSRVAPVDHLFLTLFWLVEESGRDVTYRTRYLGYALSTADHWPEATTLRETYRFVLPDTLRPGRYRFGMGVARREFTGGPGRPAVPDREALRDPTQLLQLGWFEVR